MNKLLDSLVTITSSDSAQVYEIDLAASELCPVAASSASEDRRMWRVSRSCSLETLKWAESLDQPAILPRASVHLQGLRNPGETPAIMLVLPLRTALLVLSRSANDNFTPAQVEVAAGIGSAIDEMQVLRERLRIARQENAVLEKRLTERKVVERAKGLLQTQFGWTEEDSYYHLRRTSRQQRIPMISVAQRVIETHEQSRELLTA